MISDEQRPVNLPGFSPGAIPPQRLVEADLASINDLRQLCFQYMRDGFSIVDTNGLHVDANPAFCEMTGFSAQELIGSGPENCYWPPEEREHIEAAFAKTLLGELVDVELVFMRKNGERFPVIVKPFAIKDHNGITLYYAATVRDMAQRVHLQSALQDSEARYRGLFESAADAIVILQGETLVDCNQRALQMFGLASIDQLASRASFDFFPTLQPNGKDSRAFSFEKLSAARAGAPQFFAWRHVKVDGTVFDAEVSLSTFKQGEQTFIQAIIRDVTQRMQLEEELRLGEQRYRSLFENAGDGILIMQGEQVLDCNERVLEIYGISREQLVSLTNYSLSPTMQPNGQTSAEFYHHQIQALQSGIPQSFEWHGKKLDGTPIETEVTLTAFHLDGKLCTQSLIRDITERKQLEASIRDSETRFRTLFENSGDAISILKNGKTIDCNKRLCEFYGVTREEVLSAYVGEFFPQTQPNGQSSSQFFADKVRAARQGHPQIYEWHGAKRDGTKIITEINLSALVIDGEVFEQAVARDITQRKQMEGEISDSNVRFRTLFEHSGEAISIIKDFQIIDCNERLGALYGYSRDEILSNPTAGYISPRQPNGQDSLEFLAEKVAASRAGTPQHYEWHGRKGDGTDIVVEISLASFRLGDETFEQATTRDITQRKQMEAALLELNKSLESRVAQRTEELETACAELLQRNAQFRALASRLTRAEEDERRRIARLLHDNHQQLLVAAKFKAEMLVTHLYGSDVNTAGAQIVEVLEQALDVTRSLTMELAPPILYGSGFVDAMRWLSVWMEENHHLQVLVSGSLPTIPIPAEVSSVLFRAVRELLFNVSKHAGVKQARVDMVAFDQGLRVTVSDDGSGFDVADVLHKPRSYGLFSIREQLTSLDGVLDIISAPHSGTVCTFSVPVPASADVLPPVTWSEGDLITTDVADTQQTSTHPIRILVADDHALARDALVQILGLVEDFDVVGEAFDGLDAVEKTRLLEPEVVLMDATMPRLNGLEATSRITAEFPNIKVIGLSMHARQDMEPQMREAGAAYYLQKHSPTEQLYAAIRGVMEKDVAGGVE
jgi:PAS domain S-box-containing protein